MKSEAQKRAEKKYIKSHYKRVTIDLRNDIYEELSKKAHELGETPNGYIKKAIKERMSINEEEQ